MRRDTVEGIEVEVAETAFERLRGLLGRPEPPPGHGLLIPRCNCIHTCFMRYPIDVRFLDRSNRVVRMVKDVHPGCLWVWGGWKARSALETPARHMKG